MSNLWKHLLEHNLVKGQEPKDGYIDIPWYIRFMQGFAGWLAGLFLLGFFGVSFSLLFKEPTAHFLMLVGILCSIAAFFIIKLQKNDFLDQLALAFSLCGQIIVAIALFLIMKIELEVALFVLFAYQLTFALLIPHYAHRLMTTAFSLLSFLLFLNLIGFYGLGTAFLAVAFSFIWLKEIQWKNKRYFWESIGYAVATTIVFSSGFLITGKHFLYQSAEITQSWLLTNAALISSVIIALIFLNCVWVFLKENQIRLNSLSAQLSLIAAFGLIVISIKIPGISVGLLLLLMGFARQKLALMVLGGVSVLSFFSWYYYNLDQTLLFKSITLIIMGGIALTFWAMINYLFSQKKAVKPAYLKFNSIEKAKWLTIGVVLVTLVMVNININKKENLMINGEILLFELAPVDPRSIMQGDYMSLRFNLGNEIIRALNQRNQNNTIAIHQGYAIAEKDKNNVVQFVDLQSQKNLKSHQFLIPYKFRNYQVVFTTNAFYFQEGMADHFENAVYGQFRRSKEGELLLVNMVDENFSVL